MMDVASRPVSSAAGADLGLEPQGSQPRASVQSANELQCIIMNTTVYRRGESLF
jgi:hypothetical protein